MKDERSDNAEVKFAAEKTAQIADNYAKLQTTSFSKKLRRSIP